MKRKNATERNRAHVIMAKTNSFCVDCGAKTNLEFDHVRGEKKHTVHRMIQRGSTLTMLKAEISKCEIRCRNCHDIKHGEART